ncbi:MAG: PAS domain-containing protein [Bacillota bacterium]
MEGTLLEQEDKYQKYFKNSINAIFVADSNGNYIDVNTAACIMLGYSQEELLNLSIAEIIPAETRDIVMKSFDLLKVTGELVMEATLVKKNGTIFDVQLNCFKASEKEFVAFCHDVTERKQADKALRSSEKNIGNYSIA